jgi:hypothetical protein
MEDSLLNNETGDNLAQALALLPAADHNRLRRSLSKIVARYSAKPRVTGNTLKEQRVRKVLNAVDDASRAFISLSNEIGLLKGTARSDFSNYLTGLRGARGLRGSGKPLQIECQLLSAGLDAVLAARALSITRGVSYKAGKTKPKVPYTSAASELMHVWQQATGKKVTTPKVGTGRNGSKTNATRSAEFIYQVLRLIDPAVSEQNCRTAIKNALVAKESWDAMATDLSRRGGSLSGAMTILLKEQKGRSAAKGSGSLPG